MKKLTILFSVLALVAFSATALAIPTDMPHLYIHDGLSPDKTVDEGFILHWAGSISGALTAEMWCSPGDDTADKYRYYRMSYGDASGAWDNGFRRDGFSVSNGISEWLAAGKPALLYSRTMDTAVSPGYQDGNNTNIRIKKADGSDLLFKYGTVDNPPAGTSLGISPETKYLNGLTREKNIMAYDYIPVSPPPAPGNEDTRFYYSGAKKGEFAGGNMTQVGPAGFNRSSFAWLNASTDGSGIRPYASYAACVHEADIISQAITEWDAWGTTKYGAPDMFEVAWRLAAFMLRDQKGYNPDNDGNGIGDMDDILLGNLFWNQNGTNFDANGGQVVDGTGTAVPGLTYYNEFMREVFDINALIVQDVGIDGEFNVGEDYIIFSVVDDDTYDLAYEWDSSPVSASQPSINHAGQYFDGNQVFLYDGTGISLLDTIITDPDHIGTRSDQIDALDISMIPEPGTIMMVIGGALALAGGIIRKRLH